MTASKEEYRKRGILFGEGTRVYGKVEFGDDVVIGDYSIIGYDHEQSSYANTVIASGARIGPYSVIYAGASIGARAKIEPYCSVGHGTLIGAQCRLLYRSQLHRDVTVGANSIIGGFLCDRALVGCDCRVFGRFLHRAIPPWTDWDQTIEPAPMVADRVFIGMGAQLIGDIKIGKGSYIAASAIVTRSVPASMFVKGVNQVSPLDLQWT